MEPALAVEGLSAGYARKGLALDDVNLVVPKGGIVALLGANGAGKTTLFICITGMIAPTKGAVRFEGRDIAGFGAHRISRLGISRTFQNLALFGGLTVLENLMVGAYQRGRSGLLEGALLSGRARREQRGAGDSDFSGVG